MGALASIGGAILGWVLKLASGDVIGKALDALGKGQDGEIKLAQIRAGLDGKLIDATNARQAAKLNQPVFWIIVCVMMGPPALLFWSVAVYNIFFWQHGLWPQGWSIAEFPPSVKPWAEKAIAWLYDPISAPATVAAAAVAGKLTGRR